MGTPPDFSLAASPAALTLTAGSGTQQISVAATAVAGFSAPVSVTVGGLAMGVKAQPSSFTLAAGASQTVTFAADGSAAAGSSTATLAGVSGSISHSATLGLMITVPPAADFSLGVSPASLTLTAGALGQQATISAMGTNGFSGAVAVSFAGLPVGVAVSPSSLSLVPGAPQQITFAAAANAVTGASTVSVTGQSGMLSHSGSIALTIAAPSGQDAVTYHMDTARTGLNAKETKLTLANVRSTTFGKLNVLAADGKVDAEPLYLSGVTIKGAMHNVLYVVTEHDSVYAFDADDGTQLWKVSALGSGEIPSDDHNCNQIQPEIGITSTPVIDRKKGTNGTMFVVAMSKDSGGAYHQRLHALDVVTGAEVSGGPAEIAGSYPGSGANSKNGSVVFDPGQYAERAGLLLLNGTVYLAWTSHCDIKPYTGWVMGYNEETLQQTRILNLTPNGSEGSIWMSGAGMAADTSGNIYFLDANGTWDTTLNAEGFPTAGDYGNAIVKLTTANTALKVADYFEPYDTVAESNSDLDLGSGGALVLPDLTDAAGTIRHLLVGAGKDHNIYVVDRDNMGKYNSANNGNVYQQLSGALPDGAFSMPAYFNNTVYYGGVGDSLRAFPIVAAKLSALPSSKSAATFAYPGSTPSVSANGVNNAIVWAVESATTGAAVLRAYDAANLASELYDSTQAANGRDYFGNGNKFITPLVVGGKVYVGTPSGVAVFGLLGTP